MIKIYNTLTRKKQELPEKKIGMYVCGPTVYDEPHIGHARSAYIFDMIIKYLKVSGLKVIFVRNVTDIDDKIIDRAKKDLASRTLKERTSQIASLYLKRYHEDMELLGLEKPSKEPKATEVIPDIIAFVEELIKKGYAYPVSGNVYFDVRKFKGYGKLSGQSLDEMEEGARVAVDKNKLDPLDFALWKASKDDEPSWPSPWGEGRPGWHIECSVMSTKFLGNKFTIHGGGLDLVFPHHENEIAQTEACGRSSAKYWIHNGLLTIDGRKMSKSLGNFISIRAFLAKFGDIDLLKLLFLSSHYRHAVDYTEEKIEEMRRAKERIIILLKNIGESRVQGPGSRVKEEIERIEKEFTEAMDDDFNTPLALGAIFKLVTLGNAALSKKDPAPLSKIKKRIKALCGILGLTLEEPEVDKAFEKKVKELITERNNARKNKDFHAADKIRQGLLKEGVVLEDTKSGTVWRRRV